LVLQHQSSSLRQSPNTPMPAVHMPLHPQQQQMQQQHPAQGAKLIQGGGGGGAPAEMPTFMPHQSPNIHSGPTSLNYSSNHTMGPYSLNSSMQGGGGGGLSSHNNSAHSSFNHSRLGGAGGGSASSNNNNNMSGRGSFGGSNSSRRHGAGAGGLPTPGSMLNAVDPKRRMSGNSGPATPTSAHGGLPHNVPPPGPCTSGDPSDKGSKQLIVNYLAPEVQEPELFDLFEQFGQIECVKIVQDKQNGGTKGFGFVYFSNSANAANAIKYLHGHDFRGTYLRVGFAVPQPSSSAEY
jgi:hypothetical protein